MIGSGEGLSFWLARMARVVITLIRQGLLYGQRLELSGHSVAIYQLSMACESLYEPIERREDR